MCARAHHGIGTPDQAIWTFDQKAACAGLDARSTGSKQQAKKRKPDQETRKHDHSIQRRNRREERMNASPTRKRRSRKMITHRGNCFCGAVEIQVEGAPEAMGYCHCSSCRSWAAAPVNAFTLWKPQCVRVTKGAEFIGKFVKTEASLRRYCKRCGGTLM